MDSKKKKEFSQLCTALSLLEGVDYTFLDKNSESPDFLLNLNGKVLDVELTSVFCKLGNGNSAKTQSDLPKLGEDAVNYYQQLGGQPLSFHFCFYGDESIVSRNKASKTLGKWLFDSMAQDNILSDSELNLSSLPQSLKKLTSLIFADPSPSSVSSSIVYSKFRSQTIDESILNSVIQKKDSLIRKYKEKCETIWLLIVLPSLTLSPDFKLWDGSIAIEHNFDNIYVFDEYRCKIKAI